MSTRNFEFKRDADRRPLWHNPLPNPEFDPHRPYEPDNSPFSTCGMCGADGDIAREYAALSPATPTLDDADRLAALLHADPALCAKRSPHGHPSWMRSPLCVSVAQRIAARLRENQHD